MAPTDAEKIDLLASALDRLVVAMQYGKYHEKIDAILAATEAKRLAQTAGKSLSQEEIAEIRGAKSSNEAAVTAYAGALPWLLDELMELRRRDAEHVYNDKVLRDRVQDLERQIETVKAEGDLPKA